MGCLLSVSSTPLHEYHNWYNNTRWRRLRATHLSRNPLCVTCLSDGIATDCSGKGVGRGKAKGYVDHKIPHRGNADLFWDPENLQTLCPTHHNSLKKMEEMRGVKIVRGASMDGWPRSREEANLERMKGVSL
jgi:5-methylcytosine-specific restriction endonuclease McrA